MITSSAVSLGYKAVLPVKNPILDLTSKDCRTISNPATLAVPEVGLRVVESSLKAVVFPAPFKPRRPKISPGLQVKLAWSTALINPLFLS